jgi:hypothetical protein
MGTQFSEGEREKKMILSRSDSTFSKRYTTVMTCSAFTLSSAGLSNLPEDGNLNDFEFIIVGRRYGCRKAIADFLSPKVAQLHATDPTLSEFSLPAKDPGRLFKRFMSLGRGSEILIGDSDRPFLAAISRELGNAELYARVAKELPRDLTLDILVEHFPFLTSADPPHSGVLGFLASHFTDIPDGLFDQLSVANLSEILSHSQLRIYGEDWLHQRLAATFSRKPDFFCLIEFVKFEFLSAASLANFVEISPNFLSDINISIWSGISRRLLVPVSESDVEISGPTFGIISHLTREHKGNVHDLGIVVVTQGGCNGAARVGSNATRLESPRSTSSRRTRPTSGCVTTSES